MKPQPGTPTSDRQLAEALLRAGEERAFRELYRRNTPRLYRLLLRLLGNDVRDAEDAVQETFLRAWRAIERFDGRSRLSTWLYRVCVNVCLNTLRRRRRVDAADIADLKASGWLVKPAVRYRLDEKGGVSTFLQATGATKAIGGQPDRAAASVLAAASRPWCAS